MEKKYTMEEFKKMFDEKTMKIIKEEIEANSKATEDKMLAMMVSMQSSAVLSKLRHEIFGGEK